jgi:hypothetical protein
MLKKKSTRASSYYRVVASPASSLIPTVASALLLQKLGQRLVVRGQEVCVPSFHNNKLQIAAEAG